MINLDTAKRRPLVQNHVAGIIRATAIGLFAVVIWAAGLVTADAMPATAPAFHSNSMIVKALTTCDTRGCFTFGPRQSYHRPNYPPLGQTGPGFANPLAKRPPRFIFRPQPPKPLPQARLPAADPSFHRQDCMNRYRTYNPLTDSYIGSGRKSVRCVLPPRR